MSDKAVGGPLAVDLLSIGNSWIVQSGGNNDQATRAVGQGANGDAVASKLHDNKNDITITLKHFGTSGNLVIPSVGTVSNGYCVTGLKLSLKPNDWPELQLTAHNHDSNAHSTGLNVFACPLTIPAGFGVPSLFTDVVGTAGRAGATIDMSCDHVDDLGAGTDATEHLAGQNVNGQCKVDLQYTGTPNITAAAASLGFDLVTSNAETKNTAFNTTAIHLEKSVLRT